MSTRFLATEAVLTSLSSIKLPSGTTGTTGTTLNLSPAGSGTTSGTTMLSTQFKNWLASNPTFAENDLAARLGLTPVTSPAPQPDQGSGGSTSGGSTSGGSTGGTSGSAGTTMNGFKASYFTLAAGVSNLDQIDFDAAPTATGMVDSLNYFKTREAFWQDGPRSNFAALFEGSVNVAKAGSYTLYLTSDDGSMLYVDGKPVLDNDGLHATRTRQVTLDLDAGAHEIEIRYFEKTGVQSLKFEWAGPDTDGARKLVEGADISHIHGDSGHNHGETRGETTGSTSGSTDGSTSGSTDGSTSGSTTGGTDDGHDHGGTSGSTDGTTGGTTGGTTTADGTSGSGGTSGSTSGSTSGGMTGSTDDGHDHGGTSGSTTPLPQTSAEIEAFVKAVKAAPDGHAHGDNPGKAAEHMAALDLVPRAEATHVAVANGDWFDASTWYQGRIPGTDAKVLIPEGVSVTYDGQSDASLFTVRVDGELSFATDTDTRMIVDTMVVSPTGRLEIGTEENPVEAGVKAEVVIANNGDIDVNWDPMLLSRGIISHGETEIHGAEKTPFLKVADAPMAGDRTIELAEVPEGWRVGDTIVVSGTHKKGHEWGGTGTGVIYEESEDEEVVITAISGNKITIDRPLEYDHDTPREDLFAYVANMTRNITFASEDGEATEVHHRGHVMFMHSDNVDVRYAAFDDLGRTDKSEPAFDVTELSSVAPDSNIKSRYPFHFHMTGTTDAENPAIAIGNTISGAPGWGFVHHSSNADFIGNVAFDIFGAAFVAEAGDETGVWMGNMAIKVEGHGRTVAAIKDGDDVIRQDTGRTGDGFFFAGRLVEVTENVAVNTTFGFVWMHRKAQADPLTDSLPFPEIARGEDTIGVNEQPIMTFHDNEAFGTQIGLVVVKGNPKQGHDLRSVFDGFLNWETAQGVDVSYTSHYTFKDFDLVATERTDGVGGADTGFSIGKNTYDMVINGLTVTGFKIGVSLSDPSGFTFNIDAGDVRNVIIDADMIDVGTEFEGFNSKYHTVLDSSDLVEGRLTFKMTGDTTLTVADREDIYFDGIKTDSIGSDDRQFNQDKQRLTYEEAENLLQTEGYYTTSDGRKVMFVEDFVTDRTTGEIYKFAHVITLDATTAELDKIGAVYNGTVTLGGKAPVVADDSARTAMGEGVIIDVLANDRDPEGRALTVDGMTDPVFGEVFVRDDGQLLYRPYEGYTGTDSFSYWAADDAGHFSQATVTVEVWDV